MDIYQAIKSDHMRISRLVRKINQLPSGSADERRVLFQDLKKELTMHNDSKETTFYIALQYHAETEKETAISKSEHREIGSLLNDLDTDMGNSKEWYKKFARLQIVLFRHMRREEGKVFAQARKVIPAVLAKILSTEMQNIKKLYRENVPVQDNREQKYMEDSYA